MKLFDPFLPIILLDIKSISWLTKPLSGNIIIKERNINKIKDEYFNYIEYVGHENAIKNSLTVKENLNFFLKIKKNLTKTNLNKAIKIFNLKKILDIKVENLSSGEKRRVSLSKLILSNSKIWFLDEPTTGVDKVNVSNFLKILKNHLNSNGLAIIATHDNIKIKNRTINLWIW